VLQGSPKTNHAQLYDDLELSWLSESSGLLREATHIGSASNDSLGFHQWVSAGADIHTHAMQDGYPVAQVRDGGVGSAGVGLIDLGL
jgi:hypothetical protein